MIMVGHGGRRFSKESISLIYIIATILLMVEKWFKPIICVCVCVYVRGLYAYHFLSSGSFAGKVSFIMIITKDRKSVV